MLAKLVSTVVPVYLHIVSDPTPSPVAYQTYFKNSIKDRFVNTMLVESQSSIPMKTDVSADVVGWNERLRTKADGPVLLLGHIDDGGRSESGYNSAIIF